LFHCITDAVAGAACLKCIPGKYQPRHSKELCIDCDANTFSSKSNSSKCVSCELGKISEAGASRCQFCEAGKYGSVCGVCARGMYRPGGNDISGETCFNCTVGRFQPIEGQAS